MAYDTIKLNGDIHVYYYTICDSHFSTVFRELVIYSLLGNEYFCTQQGILVNIKNVVGKLSGNIINNISISVNKFSGYVYDKNIQTIQSHESMTSFCLNWDKQFVRESYPPCILVILNSDKVDAFFEWVTTILPNVKFSLSEMFETVDTKTKEDKYVEMIQNLALKLNNVVKLMKEGILCIMD